MGESGARYIWFYIAMCVYKTRKWFYLPSWHTLAPPAWPGHGAASPIDTVLCVALSSFATLDTGF